MSTDSDRALTSNALHQRTRTVRAGVEDDQHYGAVIPPLHLSTTYSFAGFAQPRKHDYSRSGNPTRDLLAQALADLERGAGATVTATGMAAITTVLQLLQPGDLILAPADCYGGSWRLLDALSRRNALRLQWVNFRDAADWQPALRQNPRMLWLETPSNPLLRITDIARVAAARSNDCLLVVDNTFLSPVLQNPLALGADIVVHSTTKYINGHSDVVGGAIISASTELAEQLAWWANCLGVTGSAFDSWLTLRGLRTLPLRMQQHQVTAQCVAEFLQSHAAINKVHYPGLASHPEHALAQTQQRGFGAIISFELLGGESEVAAMLEHLQHISLAESLGGVESLICHPATMTHAAMTTVARQRAGISAGLIRLSVGLEHADDLINDLQQALTQCTAGKQQQPAGQNTARVQSKTGKLSEVSHELL